MHRANSRGDAELQVELARFDNRVRIETEIRMDAPEEIKAEQGLGEKQDRG